MNENKPPGAKVITFPNSNVEAPSEVPDYEAIPDDGYVIEDEDAEVIVTKPGRRWQNVPQMLSDIMHKIASNQITPTGAIVLLLDDDPDSDRDQVAYFSMGMTRIEILGLLTEMIRETP